MANEQFEPFHSAGEPIRPMAPAQYRRLLERVGYSVFERTAHVGRSWDFRCPGKTPMQSNQYRSQDAAWAAAYVRFVSELANARTLIAKVDDFWRKENQSV